VSAAGRSHGGSLTLSFFDDALQPATLDGWRAARRAKSSKLHSLQPGLHCDLKEISNNNTFTGPFGCSSEKTYSVANMKLRLSTHGRMHSASVNICAASEGLLDFEKDHVFLDEDA